MKIYSQTLDLRNPLKQRFYVAPYSMFKLGVKVVLDGEPAEGSVKLFKGEQEMLADSDLTGGFKTFQITSTVPGAVKYKVEYKADEEAESQYFYIVQETTDSTVFEVGGEGGSIPEGNFVKSVNGEYPVNSNVDVTKLAYTTDEGEDAWLTGKTIADSLNNIDAELDKKADEDDVNDKINQFAAHYLTKMNNSQFATHAELAAAKQALIDDPDTPQFKYGDSAHIPDKNDYLIIVADETHGGKTARYSFVGDWPDGYFRFQYTINDTSFTPAQIDALESGVKADNVIELAGEYEDGETFNFTVYVKE